MMLQFEEWHVAKPRQSVICMARANETTGGAYDKRDYYVR
jgi:hypothetical protein